MRIQLIILIVLFYKARAIFHNKSDKVIDIRRVPSDFFKLKFIRHIKGISTTDKCISQLKTIIRGLGSKDPMTFYHSFEVFDAWGGIPSGITYGHMRDMGNYQQCIHINYTTFSNSRKAEVVDIVGQYCQVSMAYFLDRNIKLTPGIGICIPKECDKVKISELFNDALRGLDILVNNCSTKDGMHWTVLDYAALAICGFIVFLIALSTFYDLYSEKLGIEKKALYIAFSVIKNTHKLLAMDLSPSKDSITCLHGIRALSMIWIVYGHILVWYIYFSVMNLTKFKEFFYSASSLVVNESIMCVDTLFVLSGLLISWIELEKLGQNNGKIRFIRMYIQRIFRIFPTIVVMVLFLLTFMKFCGSGPVWPSLLDVQQKACQKNWWKNLLFIQNFEDFDDICLIVTWYVAVDTQLYLISPLLILALYKWHNKCIPAFILTIGLSIGCTYALFFKNNFTGLGVTLDEMKSRLRTTYTGTHVRFTTWLIGITFGYIMTIFKNKEVRIPQTLNILGWTSALAVLLSIVFGPYNSRQPGYNLTVFGAATYDAFSRIGWALAICWIIFACHYGYGGLINDFLSHPLWHAFSKLTFSLYISHYTIQAIIFGNFQTSLYHSVFDMIDKFWFTLGISLLGSYVLAVCCEIPFANLEEFLFKRRDKERSKIDVRQ